MPDCSAGEAVANRPAPTVGETQPVRAAARKMKARRSSAVLVVERGRLVGICTERDIVFGVVAAGLDPAKTPVADIMTREPQTIAADRPFGHALHLMYEGGFRHVPVIDAEGKPIGLLAASDALGDDGRQLEEELVRREEITVIL
ncbi:MAG TPA: CBS domain-containing protein [Rhodocyclaceae bacterium]